MYQQFALGVRLVKNASALCICQSVLKVTNNMCNACVISFIQTQVQSKAIEMRQENERKYLRNLENPPIFALAPRYSSVGRLKAESGWLICRLCKNTQSKKKDNYNSIDGLNGNDNNYNAEEDGDEGSDTLMIDRRNNDNDLNTSDNNTEDDDVNDDNSSLKSLQVSLASENSLENAKKEVLETKNFMKIPIEFQHHDLPENWYEIYDVEESTGLKYGDKVLVTRYKHILKQYGTVKRQIKSNFYLIVYDDHFISDEIIHRSYLELLSRRKFFCNVAAGYSTWSKDDILDTNNGDNSTNDIDNQLLSSESLTLTGTNWLEFYNQSVLRRTFDQWEEMINPDIDQIFYIQSENLKYESKAIKIQNFIRSKLFFPIPCQHWTSISFTFDVPAIVSKLKKVKSG